VNGAIYTVAWKVENGETKVDRFPVFQQLFFKLNDLTWKKEDGLGRKARKRLEFEDYLLIFF